ncbi:MAG: ABC transporter permease subunit [Pseudomonadota bacterium]
MIGAITSKEIRGFLRSGVFISLAIAMIALLAGAAALSAQRIATFERERHAAEAVDREVWDTQGARNPHSAAHFSRYAFKPVPELVAFDPGVTDYAGLALWMEAHVQNPAVFRRAEDLGDAGRFVDLSPAWILQYIAPLFVFLILFGAIAGEREQGTFRQMVASGVSSTTLLAGKLSGAGLAVGVIVFPALLFVLFAASFSGGAGVLTDVGLRSAGLFAVYVLYSLTLGGVALGVSALFKDKRTALLALVGLWAVSFILAPRVASGLAATAYPEPDAAQLTRDLRSASDAFYADRAYRDRIEREILAEYGVDTIEELPIDYGAYTLQKSEEHAQPLFEAFYARLDDIHKKQEQLLNRFSVIAPVMALEKLSAGLSGSDRLHQKDFVNAVEGHRRVIVKQLNDDLMYNAGEAGYGYTADETLWREIPDFEYASPRFASVASNYTLSALLLAIYAIISLFFAAVALKRAQRRVAS